MAVSTVLREQLKERDGGKLATRKITDSFCGGSSNDVFLNYFFTSCQHADTQRRRTELQLNSSEVWLACRRVGRRWRVEGGGWRVEGGRGRGRGGRRLECGMMGSR